MSTLFTDSIQELEGVTFRAWPAEELVMRAGWALRFMDGISSRGNSVFTSATAGASLAEREAPAAALEPRIREVERFYAERKLPPKFHLSPASPPALDGVLAARGYHVEKPVSVQVAEVSELAGARSHAVEVSTTLTERWFALAGARSRFSAHQAAYRGLLSRLGERAAYALATLDGAPAATALGVLDGAWLGVHSMLTQPESRRKGLAQALLAELARYGHAHGATHIYLLVELENAPALALYARLGFREAYRTHYRARAEVLKI